MIKKLLLDGIELHKQNKFHEASSIYKQILQLDPLAFQAMHYLGLLYLQNGFSLEGEKLINDAIGIAGEYPEAQHNLRAFQSAEQAKFIQEIDSINNSFEYPYYIYNTIGAWRMERMLDFIGPYALLDSDASWLTIGDAYGHDAKILKNSGIQNITASNLEASILKAGAELGEVDKFLNINAEQINLPDSTFNYVLCKEALHHMPRPYLAIYEMLRVSKNAVFLVEPLDTIVDYDKPSLSNVERTKKIDNSKNSYINEYVSYNWPADNEGNSNKYEVFIDWYEDGAFNYVYTLSARELRKICYGLGLPGYAVKPFNDIYDSRLNDLESNEQNISLQQIQLNMQDLFCKASGKPYAYISCILFKSFPNQKIINELKNIGFSIFQTPTIFMPFKFEI
jgi:SAM-dependent methyltransferase